MTFSKVKKELSTCFLRIVQQRLASVNVGGQCHGFSVWKTSSILFLNGHDSRIVIVYFTKLWNCVTISLSGHL